MAGIVVLGIFLIAAQTVCQLSRKSGGTVTLASIISDFRRKDIVKERRRDVSLYTTPPIHILIRRLKSIIISGLSGFRGFFRLIVLGFYDFCGGSCYLFFFQSFRLLLWLGAFCLGFLRSLSFCLLLILVFALRLCCSPFCSTPAPWSFFCGAGVSGVSSGI